MKRALLLTYLAVMLFCLSGCLIQPDPTLEPLTITEGTIPFGTVQPLPTATATPVPAATPSPTPDTWSSSDQSKWEDWSQAALPTSTPRKAATAAPDAQKPRRKELARSARIGNVLGGEIRLCLGDDFAPVHQNGMSSISTALSGKSGSAGAGRGSVDVPSALSTSTLSPVKSVK